MSNTEEMITTLKEQIEAKKIALKELRERYREVRKPGQRRSMSPVITSRYNIESLHKQLGIYDTEKKILSNRLVEVGGVKEISLNEKIKNLDEKLALLTRENIRLNKYISINLPPIHKNLENEDDLQNHIKQLKKTINSIEEKNMSNKMLIEKSGQKAMELENVYNQLKNEAGDTIIDVNKDKYNELGKKLKVLEKAWKCNTQRFENCIKELESVEKNLEDEKTQLKSKIIKYEQQRRLLNMSQDEYRKMIKDGMQAPEITSVFNPGVSFLYKPSVKALYSM
ncbi:hypothetical protein SteCoe_32014 [Stentor coeruleus]|uniref:Uncharacterized protein n=1 Tax=Stentor coeruleus TaxID=5963 RepID=A0A1R2B032_9CILI|nr:hypothetical protein SteCoe_32014 [Stentor coeruleus]